MAYRVQQELQLLSLLAPDAAVLMDNSCWTPMTAVPTSRRYSVAVKDFAYLALNAIYCMGQHRPGPAVVVAESSSH